MSKISPIKALEQMILSKDCPIDLREVAYEFMKKIGGPKGLVRLIMTEYEESKTGGLARARILDIMMRLFQQTSPKGGVGDLGQLSDEDLRRLLDERLKLLGSSHGQENDRSGPGADAPATA